MKKTIKGKIFELREDSLDEYVVRESCYNKCNFNKEDVWLDIGGNIGAFAVNYSDKVCAIISYEPDKENIELFKKNIEFNKVNNSILVEKAVIDNFDTEVEFFLNVKKNKGAHSMFVKRGRQKVVVPSININEVLKEVQPNKIKMDVEGGEYQLIKAIEDWGNIEEFIFEYHISILRDSNGLKLKELYGILNNNFSYVNGKGHDNLGKNWITIIHCKK